MLYGLGLLVSFVVGAVCMFVVSEHYYHRIENLLHLKRDERSDRRR